MDIEVNKFLRQRMIAKAVKDMSKNYFSKSNLIDMMKTCELVSISLYVTHKFSWPDHLNTPTPTHTHTSTHHGAFYVSVSQ